MSCFRAPAKVPMAAMAVDHGSPWEACQVRNATRAAGRALAVTRSSRRCGIKGSRGGSKRRLEVLMRPLSSLKSDS